MNLGASTEEAFSMGGLFEKKGSSLLSRHFDNIEFARSSVSRHLFSILLARLSLSIHFESIAFTNFCFSIFGETSPENGLDFST